LLSDNLLFSNINLDELDRLLIEAVCRHGRDGQSFNRLYAEVSSKVSRSTFASRLDRLKRLKIIEKVPDSSEKQRVHLIGKPMILMLYRTAIRIKEQCIELEERIRQEEELIKDNSSSKDTIVKSLEFLSDRLRSVFSIIGSYLVIYGPSLTSSLLIPLVTDDFRSLFNAFMKLISLNPELSRLLATKYLSGLQLRHVIEDLEYSFGVRLEEEFPLMLNWLSNLQ
jgi:DNA-binding Lrp family transcriptional regulator